MIGVLLVFWWGFGVLPKLFVIVLICFFPVVVTTVDGLSSVDPDQLKLLRTLGASRWQALRFGELPAAVPAALSGARIALAVGVIGAYIAETSTATSGPYPGLGREIEATVTSFRKVDFTTGGQNFIIAYSEAGKDATLGRADQPDEYVVLLPDPGGGAEIVWGS